TSAQAMKIAASACASGVGCQENPIAAVRIPAMATQSTVSCGALSRLRAALSGVIACDPSVERWQRTMHSVGARGKQRKNARVIEDSACRLQQTCAPSAPVMLSLVLSDCNLATSIDIGGRKGEVPPADIRSKRAALRRPKFTLIVAQSTPPRGQKAPVAAGRRDVDEGRPSARRARSWWLRLAQASPTALDAQAFGEVATEQMLPEMPELAVEIDPDLAAHVAPTAAKRVILGQVPARIRIDHAVKEAPIKMRLRVVRRTVGHVVELRVLLHHQLEHMALDHHEAGRRLRHLDEAIVVCVLADAGLAVIDRVERVIGIGGLELLPRHAGGYALGRPVERLHGIDAGGDVSVCQQQTKDRVRVECDVGVDPKQVGERFLGEELEHDLVAAARDQAFAVEMQDAGKTNMRAVEGQAENACDVVHADPRNVAGGRKHPPLRLRG